MERYAYLVTRTNNEVPPRSMTTRQRLKGSCEFQCWFTLADSYAGSEPRRASGDWRSVEGERSHGRWWRGVEKVQQDQDEHCTNETEMGWRGGVGARHEVGSSRSEGDYGRDEVGGGWGRGREYGKNFGEMWPVVCTCLVVAVLRHTRALRT